MTETSSPEQHALPPDVAYIKLAFESITQYCIQYKTRQPLDAFRKATDVYREIMRDLGTASHDQAATKLKKAVAVTSKESKGWWRAPWDRYQKHRKMASELEAAERQRLADEAELMARIKEEELPEDAPPELRQAYNKMMEAMSEPFDLDMSPIYKNSHRAFFQIDIAIFNLYFGFFKRRLMNIFIRHFLILLLPICAIGLLASKAANRLTAWISDATGIGWLALALILLYLIFKRYVIDPAVNKVLKRLDAVRLRKLCFAWLTVCVMQALRSHETRF